LVAFTPFRAFRRHLEILTNWPFQRLDCLSREIVNT
jgi:hypothetical protein